MQAAWRAGRWADADGSVAELAQQQGSDGFHACFTSALLATSAGEVLKCSAALSRGRASVMRGIALTGAESAASINTAIVRLQLLDEVSDVANERWGTPAAAAASSLGDVVTTDLTRRWDSIHTAQHGGRCVLCLCAPLRGRLTCAAQVRPSRAAACRTLGSVQRCRKRVRLSALAHGSCRCRARGWAGQRGPGAHSRDQDCVCRWVSCRRLCCCCVRFRRSCGRPLA